MHAPVAFPRTIPRRGIGVASSRWSWPTSRSQITARPKKIAMKSAAWAITPGREIGAVVVVTAAQDAVALQRRAEDEEPEQRLHRAREDVEVVVAELAQLGPAHRGRAVAQAVEPGEERLRPKLSRGDLKVCGRRGHS